MIDNVKQKEVRVIKINFVGSVSNYEEMEEIETVAKVFIIAKRIIDLTNDVKSKSNNSEPTQNSPKKINNIQNSYNIKLPILTIHGFN